LTVKDNDGSPLIDASPEIEASVIAPDFGLDTPGAMLETIGPLNPITPPDVSALSLRDGEGNLVDESEFEQRDEVVVSTDHLKVSEQGPPERAFFSQPNRLPEAQSARLTLGF
jgi:hypothetical protein